MARIFDSTEPQHGDTLNTILAKRLQALGGTSQWGATDEEIQAEISKIPVFTAQQVSDMTTDVLNQVDVVQTNVNVLSEAQDSGTLDAEVLGSLWTLRTNSVNNGWEGVCYGNGRFVAVAWQGTGNRVMTSEDGIDWTTRTSAEDNHWISVCYGNGQFVAVSTDGTHQVMTSPDGITWTAQTAAAVRAWISVTYGAGLFVAVATTGSGNRVMTSPDGITWTSRSPVPDRSWACVAFSGSLFVAVAGNASANNIITSPDGITWTARNDAVAAATVWTYVTYGNSLFVAVGAGAVMTSPDGITWTSRVAASANQWASVAYGNGLFVAVSQNGTGNRIMTSADGISWTSRDSAADNQWTEVCYGNGGFVAVSYYGSTATVMTSGDTAPDPIIPEVNAPTEVWAVAGIPDDDANPTEYGGIPVRNTIYHTFNPGATASEISAKLTACTAGQVVKLNAGTYNLTGPIVVTSHSDWTLRGAGAGSTFLNFIGNYDNPSRVPALNIGNGFNWTDTKNIVVGGVGESSNKVIVGSSAANYAAGQLVAIDQTNSGSTWITYFGSGADGSPVGENLDQMGRTSGQHGAGGSGRVQVHYAKVIAATGSSITFWPPLPYDLEAARTPQISRAGARGPNNSGIEDLTVDFSSFTGQSPSRFQGVTSFWLKNVEMKTWDQNSALWFVKSASVEISSCYLHTPRVRGIDRGYGILCDGIGGSRIIDNIIYDCTSPFLLQNGCTGNVIAYNAVCFATGAYLPYSNLVHDISGNHTPFPCYNLFEGNYMGQFQSDYYYGPSGWGTLARNRIPGNSSATTDRRIAVSIDARQRNYSVVGNQLGELTAPASLALTKVPVTRTYAQTSITWTGYHPDPDTTNFSYSSAYIYRLGYPFSGSHGANSSGVAVHDAAVKGAGTLRHGNWDAFNNAVVWDDAIANHNIPDSYFLDAKPTFFQTMTWPPYGPSAPTSPVTDLEKIPAGYRLVHNADHG